MRTGLRAVVLGGIVVAVAAVGAMAVWGQGRVGPRLPQPKLPDFSVEGSIDDLRPGQIEILSSSGQPWLVRVLPNTTVHVTGKAAADFLGPDECIAFQANVEREAVPGGRPGQQADGLQPQPGVASGRVPRARPGKRHLREVHAEEGQPARRDKDRPPDRFRRWGRPRGLRHRRRSVGRPKKKTAPAAGVENRARRHPAAGGPRPGHLGQGRGITSACLTRRSKGP